MSATKTAVKRKGNDQLFVELSNPSKIRKIGKRQNLSKEQSTNNAHSSLVSSVQEKVNTNQIRQKLSSIFRFENKYKHYCKKHNVVYLLENTRRRSRELSKRSRDNLVNNFRSLDITNDVSVETQLLGHSLELLPYAKDEFHDISRDSFEQPASDPFLTNGKISRIFVISEENEIDDDLAECKQDIPISMQQAANQFNLSHFVNGFTSSDESDDSDCGDEHNEVFHEASKYEDFILTRSPGGVNIYMTEIKGSSYSNYYEDDCTYRNCLYNQRI